MLIDGAAVVVVTMVCMRFMFCFMCASVTCSCCRESIVCMGIILAAVFSILGSTSSVYSAGSEVKSVQIVLSELNMRLFDLV